MDTIVLVFLDSENRSKFQDAYSDFEAALKNFNVEYVGDEELVLSEYNIHTRERGV